MVMKKKKVVKKGGRSSGKLSGLTIHFMPYSEIAREDTLGRIKKIMGLVLDDKIIILQGKLRPDEEVRLIENSMTLIGNIDNFSGIEIATIGNSTESSIFNRMRQNIAKILIGDQDKITIIGPASVVKDIKRDPSKIELMLQNR
ncbi:MAG: hypothetical protein ACI83O_000124 [Patescibacteria group bacterium]|jgi:hypothetical protein